MPRLAGAVLGVAVGFLSGAALMILFGYALPAPLMLFLPTVTWLASFLSGSVLVMVLVWFLANLVLVWALYLTANASLSFPPPSPVAAVLVAHTPVENLCMGVIIGMTAGINLAFWSMQPISGASVIAFFTVIGFLASIPSLAIAPVFQVLVGWSAWLMPLSFLATCVGLVFLTVLAPIAIAQFGLAALRFNFAQGNIELTINFSALTGPITGTAGFSLGNLTFLFNGPPAASQTSFFGPGTATHEVGHTMNTSVLGGFFLIVNGVDQNIFPPRGVRSWGELCAESHFPSGGFFIRLWS
jgi:hypothetical protein